MKYKNIIIVFLLLVISYQHFDKQIDNKTEKMDYLKNNIQITNNIVLYFNEAEIQAETEESIKEIRQALSDLLKLDKKALLAKRYKNYQMEPVWTFFDLMQHHVVPNQKISLNPNTIFIELKDPQAKKAILAVIGAIDEKVSLSQL